MGKKSTEFCAKITHIEREISETVVRLKRRIDQEKCEPLGELASYREQGLMEVDGVDERLVQFISFHESVLTRVDVLLNDGSVTAHDLVGQVSSLLEKDHDLVPRELDAIKTTIDNLYSGNVTFSATGFLSERKNGRLVGEIDVDLPRTPTGSAFFVLKLHCLIAIK